MRFDELLVKKFSYSLMARRDGLANLCGILKDLESSQYWPKYKIIQLQEKRLKQLLIHAYENTTFYHHRFIDCGFDPYQFTGTSDLLRIPLLTKEEIRANLPELCARNVPKEQIHYSETGGTTGVKMRFARDNRCLAAKEAALLRFEKWAGWDLGQRKGIVWPAQQDYVGYHTLKAIIKNELYQKWIVFPAVILDKDSISKYLLKLKRKKPSIIRGFTSPLAEVAKFIIESRMSLPLLNGVITTGEPLYEHQRRLIAEAFRCKVFNSYRSREAGPLAQECEENDGLHVNMESLHISIESNELFQVSEKKLGEIIVTDLLNYGMPLIRYRTGDLGIISEASCSCGRCLTKITKILGRTPDIFYTTDGRPIASITLVLYLVDEAPGMIGQVQIIQDDYDHLIIKMTPDPPPTQEIMAYQLKKARALFGNDLQVTFEVVDQIPREASGKYQFTKCLIIR